MAQNSHHYSSHIPVLVQALGMTCGDVLEMGMGYFSTPVIHWICSPSRRRVLSLENNEKYYHAMAVFSNEYHQIDLVDDWDKADIERQWDVAFIDHSPSERRVIDLLRLRDCARLIVLHDTNGRQNHIHHFDQAYPQFKYIYQYRAVFPSTALLSNFVDVRGLCL